MQNVRRKQLKQWFENRTLPPKEKSYLSQLITGKASFGEKAARRLEKTYGMPPGFLDNKQIDDRENMVKIEWILSAEEKMLISDFRVLLPEQRQTHLENIRLAAEKTKRLMEQVRVRLGLPEFSNDAGNQLPKAPISKDREQKPQ